MDYPETPKAKLEQFGICGLSDSELLSLLLPVRAKAPATQRACQMLAEYGSITQAARNTKIPAVLAAMEIARRALAETLRSSDAMSSPAAIRDWLRLTYANTERESFMLITMDAQNRVIKSHMLFYGTLMQTSVYPREVVKQALADNAAATVFAHNHPSGCAEPSHADQVLTQNLKQALALVDVKVLDHFIVAGSSALSFAERGLI